MGISRMMGVDSTYSDPNSFGASVVLSLPFVYTLFRYEMRSWLRKSYCGYFVLAVLCVVLTGSRSASIALVFLLILWSMMQKGKKKLYILALVFLSLSVVWFNMPAEKKVRIRSIWDENAGPANAHSPQRVEFTDSKLAGKCLNMHRSQAWVLAAKTSLVIEWLIGRHPRAGPQSVRRSARRVWRWWYLTIYRVGCIDSTMLFKRPKSFIPNGECRGVFLFVSRCNYC